MEFKDGDIFRFHYNEAALARPLMIYPYHCFDAQLFFDAKSGLLVDTYWAHFDVKTMRFSAFGVDPRTMTSERAERDGMLTFVVNLDVCEPVDERSYKQGLYLEGDAFNLTHHAGCHKVFVKRRGARKDSLCMRGALLAEMVKLTQEHGYAKQRLERGQITMNALLDKIDAGEEVDVVL